MIRALKKHIFILQYFKHKDELNIIGKQTALKQLKMLEDETELNLELQNLKDGASEQFNKFIKAQEIQEVKHDLENNYRKTLNVWASINKFTDYKEGHTFELHAFKKN